MEEVGADVNEATEPHGLTALAHACAAARVEAANYLLNVGADPMAPDIAGKPPLAHCLAAPDGRDSLSCAVLLLSKRAKAENHACERTGETLLHRAVRHGAAPFVRTWASFGGDLSFPAISPAIASPAAYKAAKKEWDRQAREAAAAAAGVAGDYLDADPATGEEEPEEEGGKGESLDAASGLLKMAQKKRALHLESVRRHVEVENAAAMAVHPDDEEPASGPVAEGFIEDAAAARRARARSLAVRRGAAFFDDFYGDVSARAAWSSAVDDDLCGFAPEDIAADIAPLRGLTSIEALLGTLGADGEVEEGGAKGAAAAAAGGAGPVCEATKELEAKLRAAMPSENLVMVPAFSKMSALRLLTTLSGIGGSAAAAQLNGDPYFEAETRYQGLPEYAKARARAPAEALPRASTPPPRLLPTPRRTPSSLPPTGARGIAGGHERRAGGPHEGAGGRRGEAR